MSSTIERRGYAATDLRSRSSKGAKIRKVLERRVSLDGATLLDLGAGAGYIAEEFKSAGARVTAADRECNLSNGLDIRFIEVNGIKLPFENNLFDIVIYNHVIEHVGGRIDQYNHLMEIYRIMAPGGLLYCSVPNRWTIMEPHFKLPFLSWLPASLANFYVRIFGRHDWYDCKPFAKSELYMALVDSGFEAEHITREILDIYLRDEVSASSIRRIGLILSKLFPLFSAVIPTIAFIARKPPLP